MSALCVCARVCRYRYQLEAFVDKLRGRDPEHWFDAQDSITNMEWIEAIYKEVGRHRFPSSFNWSTPRKGGRRSSALAY